MKAKGEQRYFFTFFWNSREGSLQATLCIFHTGAHGSLACKRDAAGLLTLCCGKAGSFSPLLHPNPRMGVLKVFTDIFNSGPAWNFFIKPPANPCALAQAIPCSQTCLGDARSYEFLQEKWLKDRECRIHWPPSLLLLLPGFALWSLGSKCIQSPLFWLSSCSEVIFAVAVGHHAWLKYLGSATLATNFQRSHARGGGQFEENANKGFGSFMLLE